MLFEILLQFWWAIDHDVITTLFKYVSINSGNTTENYMSKTLIEKSYLNNQGFFHIRVVISLFAQCKVDNGLKPSRNLTNFQLSVIYTFLGFLNSL
jgi:hypothetical protein